MNIKGKKVTLRAIEREDLPLLHKWANDPELWKMLGGWHFPTSMIDQEKWLQSLNVNSANQRFAIQTKEYGIVGTANLVDINWKDRNAFHGIMVGEERVRGKGYGTDTIMAIMRYAFDELALNRLDTSIIEYNEVSINIYTKKCGWKQEGSLKQWYYRQGRYWDKLLIGITAADYKSFIDNANYWGNDK